MHLVRDTLAGPTARSLVGFVAFMALTGSASEAAADDGDPHGYPSLVVQNREHFGTHEFDLSVGFLPMDAFTKGLTVGGSYTLRFNQVIGWEIVQVMHSFPVDSGLADELRAFDLEPQTFEVVETAAFSNLVFAPIYWKGSVMNDGLVRGEILFVAGGGVGWFTRSTRGAFDVGMALRVYLSTLASVRLDVRYLGFFHDQGDGLDVHSEVWLGLSLALTP